MFRSIVRLAGSIYQSGQRQHPVTLACSGPYVLLDANEHGYSVQLRRGYDREAVIKPSSIPSSHPFLPDRVHARERVPSSDPGFFQAGRPC